jgi:hypothetical protein
VASLEIWKPQPPGTLRACNGIALPYKSTVPGEYCPMRNCTYYKNIDMVAYDTCVKSFKWVGHVARMFDNGIQKHIIE